MDAAAPALCSHCGLPLPSRPWRDQREEGSFAFCCVGCLTVSRIVGATGDAGQASWFLAKLTLAAILAGNVMLFQSLLYFASRPALGDQAWHTASWLMLVLSVAVYLLLGVPMLRVAFRAARQGRIVLELLIGTGALAAIGASAFETFRGGDRTYYDSGTMVLVFVVLGQYLDARARQRASEALPPVLEQARRPARVERDGEEREVRPELVKRGERVRVRAGEEIPVDGRVLEGSSGVHEPALTGEAFPRRVQVADYVHAGSLAVDGTLTLEASGESDTLARRIERWTREARARRAPLEIAADRFVAWFIPAVALVAAASALGWGMLGHAWAKGGLAALSVLVVACPCALGIATPMATTIAVSRAAARGVLLRSGAVLEALARVRRVAFDKTGTLTRGHPQVVGARLAEADSLAESEAWGLAASVAAGVDHPFSRAIVEAARARGAEVRPAREVRAIPGAGARGSVGGHEVLLGSDGLLAERGVSNAGLDHEVGSRDASHVGVAVDGRLVARLTLEDPPRPEAREVVERLRGMGVSSSVLSGDSPAAVAALREEVGLDGRGGLGPREKPEQVRALRQAGGPVAMVGDGMNDGPALAAADVGIAFGAASDLARQAADVAMLREDLRELPRLLALSRRTTRIVKQNLGWALGYNAVGIVLGALGLLRPVLAAAAMVLSSLLVVGNSLRLRRDPS
jgi:Cu2+-exporting ATPase